MGADSVSKLREIGQTLAYLKEPEPPKGIKDAFSKLPLLKDIWSMAPNVVKNAPCQESYGKVTTLIYINFRFSIAGRKTLRRW